MKKRSTNGLTRQEILRVLRNSRSLLDRYAVRKVALFGSYAKGTQTAQSDIDLLVEFGQPTYDNFLGLSRELEMLFGKKVEILTPDGLNSIRIKEIAADIRKALEPIQEVGSHEQGLGLVNRRSMRRIMARRMKAATVRA
jgi:hypothetical protein